MYKLLLCLRYLRTRWIALASIVSVTLGVATMIVVNSVMAGFTREMQDRIKGILSDILFESKSLGGFRDPAEHMRRIEAVAGEYIDSMSASVNVFAMLWVAFISVILSLPDGMRAGKTIVGFTVLLVLGYTISERKRFKGPAWKGGEEGWGDGGMGR